MSFNVQYSFNNGAVTGTATSILQLRSAIYNYAHSGSVSDSSGSNYSHLTQCTLSGTAEGDLTTDDLQGTSTGVRYGLFENCGSLVSVDLSNLDTSNVTDTRCMFYECSSLTSLDLSNLDTSNVTSMNSIFSYCYDLTSLNLSNWNTSNVTDMNYMFFECSSLTSLDLSSFDTSNVTGMFKMFADCYELTSLDLSSFDTSNVTSMQHMFSYCESLQSLNLSNFNTSNVTDMDYMFCACSLIKSINLSSFDTSNVDNMRAMFSYCNELTSLDLSSFNTSNATDMSVMFEQCTNLQYILIGDNWDVSNVSTSDDMFRNCVKLPNYNQLYKDKTKAYVGEGGYLNNEMPEDVIIQQYIQLNGETKKAYPKVKVDGTTITSNYGVLSAEQYDDTTLSGRVSTIEDKIPNQATSTNQLADKDFVNSTMNNYSAFFITKNPQGDSFSTKAELDAATIFYSDGEVRVPTRNDYCSVLSDETKTNPITGINPQTRYIYSGSRWGFQYKMNDEPFTAVQMAAINSNITDSLVTTFTGYGTSKQDKIDSNHKLSYSLISGTPDLTTKANVGKLTVGGTEYNVVIGSSGSVGNITLVLE